MSTNDANSGETALQCVRCRYVLTGLPPDGSCPECGMSVERSHSMSIRAGTPSRRVPSVKKLLGMTLLSTCIGVPAVILFAGFSFITPWWDMWGAMLCVLFFFLLAFLGTLIPLITVMLIPAETRTERMGAWAVFCLGLVIMGIFMFFSGVFEIGMGLATMAVVLNLTRANRAIGNVIPDWNDLGAARQKKEPLLVAIVLIMAGRVLARENLISVENGSSILEFWGALALNGLEALLLIGCFYLLANRIWMVVKLFDSIRYRSSGAS